MTGEKKTTATEFNTMDWRISKCQITGCRASASGDGMKSALTGMIVLEANGCCKLRFRWNSSQVVADAKASAPIVIEQDYRAMPVLSGVLLVDDAGRPMDYDQQMRLSQALMSKLRGTWEAKIRHVAQLMR